MAWALTQKPDRQHIDVWPIAADSTGSSVSVKVPTKIRLLPSDYFEWGLGISPDAPADEIIELFKLGLDPDKISENTQNLKAKLAAHNVDYLAHKFFDGLGQHVMPVLEQVVGKERLQSLQKYVVVTVPAIWSDLAKQRTLKEFEKASNFTSHGEIELTSLISEPEAAATYSLDGLLHDGLQVGQTIVIVDAGGGTVDLVSYTVKALTPVLVVGEAAPGSAYLDIRFRDWFRG